MKKDCYKIQVFEFCKEGLKIWFLKKMVVRGQQSENIEKRELYDTLKS